MNNLSFEEHLHEDWPEIYHKFGFQKRFTLKENSGSEIQDVLSIYPDSIQLILLLLNMPAREPMLNFLEEQRKILMESSTFKQIALMSDLVVSDDLEIRFSEPERVHGINKSIKSIASEKDFEAFMRCDFLNGKGNNFADEVYSFSFEKVQNQHYAIVTIDTKNN